LTLTSKRKSESVLVVGGAGYIGSHVALMMASSGYQVTVLDNLSTGHRDSVLVDDFILCDLSDKNSLNALFSNRKFDAVMHFASHIEVGESLIQPEKYYKNNFVNTLNLLGTMIENNVHKIIFSSTAAIYGSPEYIPIDEKHQLCPINPYGQSKLMVERVLSDYESAYGLKSISLRYFNAAGAHPDAILGERHQPETHLIPLLMRVASGREEYIKIYGNDYPTPDGTCIRDYIHVMDLYSAHAIALEYLDENNLSQQFNLGNGSGFSVKEVINEVCSHTGKEIKIIEAGRRFGDPAYLVSDSSKIKEILGWKQKYADLASIISHAWQWESKYRR